mmetsp:Transcript_26890/g.56314  ORF Transcript_26890/g.56314 Transcript_26890/m.56314 type:complete len:251 (-) Transcript_26890:94-846(-)
MEWCGQVLVDIGKLIPGFLHAIAHLALRFVKFFVNVTDIRNVEVRIQAFEGFGLRGSLIESGFEGIEDFANLGLQGIHGLVHLASNAFKTFGDFGFGLFLFGKNGFHRGIQTILQGFDTTGKLQCSINVGKGQDQNSGHGAVLRFVVEPHPRGHGGHGRNGGRQHGHDHGLTLCGEFGRIGRGHFKSQISRRCGGIKVGHERCLIVGKFRVGSGRGRRRISILAQFHIRNLFVIFLVAGGHDDKDESSLI